MSQLVDLPYYGGKSPLRPTARWIAGLLGFRKRETYIEPFAGMLGVMLCRQKAQHEIVNDLNGDIVSWWMAVRDHPDEFLRRIINTPYSRSIYTECCRKFSERDYSDEIDHAVTVHVLIEQGMSHSTMRATVGQWAVGFSAEAGTIRKKWEHHIGPLHNRIRDVQLENRDAIDLLGRTTKRTDCLVYVDPPYISTDISPYGKFRFDKDELITVLRKQPGRVAVSGYRDEYDGLDWHRNEKLIKKSIPHDHRRPLSTRAPATEVLWTNFRPEHSLFD